MILEPVYIGRFPTIKSGSIDVYGIDATNDLLGSTLQSATVAVALNGVTVAGVAGAPTISSPRVTFRVTAPSTAGDYTVTVTLVFADGRSLARVGYLQVV